MEKQEITVFKQFKLDLAAFKEHNAELTFDFAIPEEEEACRVHHRKLRKLWNGIEKLKLKTTESMRDEIADTNKEAKLIQAEVDTMANPFKAQMDAKDAEEAKEIADLAAANALKAEIELDERLAYLENGERKLKAAQDAQKAIEDAATEAAEQVKRNEETAANTAKAVANAVLETERKAHEAKGQLVAEQLVEKNEAQAVIDEANRVEAARVADVEHRTKIEKKAIDYISLLVDDFVAAEMIVRAISDGNVPNVAFIY
jgi:hypothetical protein